MNYLHFEKNEREKKKRSDFYHAYTGTNLYTREANFYKSIYMENLCLTLLLPYQLIQIEFYIRGVLK